MRFDRSSRQRSLTVTVAVSLLLAGFTPQDARADAVSVHDGDTLTIDHQRWRLWGIDAPELDQICTLDGCASSGDAFRDSACLVASVRRCGVQAREALQALVANAVVRCEPRGQSYDRAVGRCYAGAVDLGAEMVRSGFALDFPQYSRGEYSVAERAARAERRGIWAGSFVMPWTWRREHGARRVAH